MSSRAVFNHIWESLNFCSIKLGILSSLLQRIKKTGGVQVHKHWGQTQICKKIGKKICPEKVKSKLLLKKFISLYFLDPDTKISVRTGLNELRKAKVDRSLYSNSATGVKNGEKRVHPTKANFHRCSIRKRWIGPERAVQWNHWWKEVRGWQSPVTDKAMAGDGGTVCWPAFIYIIQNQVA